MRDDPALGTAKKPIESTERFQVYAAHAKPRSQRATWETTGIVCRYQGELILCNYVAGALWGTDGRTDEDPTHTEKWVTYNDGKTGHDVKPSPISNTSRSDNRGCKGQNAADWLGRNGHEYPAILRYFYGADLDVGPLDPKTPTPTIPVQPTPMQAPPPAKSASDPAPLVMLAALAMNVFGGDKT